MNDLLLQMQKYGFEIAPDTGMQIAINGSGRIYKSPNDVPKLRVHAKIAGNRVQIHYDGESEDGGHRGSKFHARANQVRLLIKYVEYETDVFPGKNLIANLPPSTKVYENIYIRLVIRKLSTVTKYIKHAYTTVITK
jgi:hypothetical protein